MPFPRPNLLTFACVAAAVLVTPHWHLWKPVAFLVLAAMTLKLPPPPNSPPPFNSED